MAKEMIEQRMVTVGLLDVAESVAMRYYVGRD